MKKLLGQFKRPGERIKFDLSDHKCVNTFVKQQYDFRKVRMYDYMRAWYLQIAFFAGHQNLRWNDISRVLQEPITPTWRQNLVVNLIQPTVRTTVAKLLKRRPWMDVTPATGDQKDVFIADRSKRILQFYWKYLGIGGTLTDALFWMMTTGNIFLKTSWDSSAGEFIEVSPSDLLTAQDISQKERVVALKLFRKFFSIPSDIKLDMNKIYSLPIGEPRVDLVTPFEITVPERETKLKDVSWLIQTKVRELHELQDRYGSATNKLKEGTLEGADLQVAFQERLLATSSKSGKLFGGLNINRKDHVLVHEFWYKATRRYPRGIHYILCQDQVLNDNIENPYSHRKIPYVHLREIPVPGRFWATSVAEQLMDPQRDYNKTKSILAENRNTMSGAKWLIPNTAGIGANKISSRPFELIRYNYPFEPKPVAMPGLPSYVERTLSAGRSDIEDISGQHEVTKAQAPGQVRSGAAISLLQEADDTRLSPVSIEMDDELSRMGSMMLENIAQFVKESRLIRILGDEGGLISSFSYTGNDLRGEAEEPNVSYYDVDIKMFSQLSMSRATQLNLLERLMDKGVLLPDRDRELILHMTDLGSIVEAVGGTKKARAKQIQEINRMTQGEEIYPNFWDMHETHLLVLRDFMNSAAFDQMEPEIKEGLIIHYKSHQTLTAQELVLPEILAASESLRLQAQVQSDLEQTGVMPNEPNSGTRVPSQTSGTSRTSQSPGKSNGRVQGRTQGRTQTRTPANSINT